MTAQVEIVAHRGSREGTHEHTLAAYRRAIADGADTLECDVRLTADGHLVCLHDRRVDFVSDRRGVVSTLSLAELNAITFGARRAWRPMDRYRQDAPGRAGEAEPGVLTLRRLLEVVAEAPRPVGLAIETKHPTRYAGQVEAALVPLLTEFGLPAAGPVRVMSFSQVSLRRMRRLLPGGDLVLLMGRVPVHRRDGSLPEGVSIAGVDVRVIRRHPGYVAQAHERGHRVHAWTVNTPADIDACLAAGVDALITDRPMAVRRHLGGLRAAG